MANTKEDVRRRLLTRFMMEFFLVFWASSVSEEPERSEREPSESSSLSLFGLPGGSSIADLSARLARICVEVGDEDGEEAEGRGDEYWGGS